MRATLAKLPRPVQAGALAIGIALLAAACGTGGIDKGGDVSAGQKVFVKTCGSCHTLAAAGTSGTIGPNLDTALKTDAAADGNMALDAFIKQSIVDPEKYLAKGYTGGIMPPDFGTKLTPTQINDLVAFISSNTTQ